MKVLLQHIDNKATCRPRSFVHVQVTFVLLYVDLISGLLQTHGGDSREITDQF